VEFLDIWESDLDGEHGPRLSSRVDKTTLTSNEPDLFGTGSDPSAPNRITGPAVWEHVRNGDFSGRSQALSRLRTVVRTVARGTSVSVCRPHVPHQLMAAVGDWRHGERVDERKPQAANGFRERGGGCSGVGLLHL